MSLFRVTLSGTTVGQLWNNVLHFEKPESVQQDMILLANSVQAWIVGNPLRLHADALTVFGNIHVAVVGNQWEPIDVPLGLVGTGGFTHDQTPILAAVIQLRTGVGGRRGRGRFYLPGWGGAPLFDGFWDSDVILRGKAVAQALEDFWSPGGVAVQQNGGIVWVVASRDQGESGTVFPVTQWEFRPLVGACRRRNIGRGA